MDKYAVLVEYLVPTDGGGMVEDHFFLGVFDTQKEVELLDKSSVESLSNGTFWWPCKLSHTIVYRGNGTHWKKIPELTRSLKNE